MKTKIAGEQAEAIFTGYCTGFDPLIIITPLEITKSVRYCGSPTITAICVFRESLAEELLNRAAFDGRSISLNADFTPDTIRVWWAADEDTDFEEAERLQGEEKQSYIKGRCCFDRVLDWGADDSIWRL